MKKRSIVAVASAVAALSLVLAGCSGTATPNATGSDGAALPTVSMMVGGIDKQIYLPYQLAESLGFQEGSLSHPATFVVERAFVG